VSLNKKSISVRFISTLTTNLLRIVFSFTTGLIIARTLGPSEYGNYNFLLGSFISLATLVDMASSSAFYTFISQKQRGRRFFLYYTTWIFTQSVILLGITLFIPETFKKKLWLGQPVELILLALFVTLSMNIIWKLAGQIGESVRDTIGVQIRNLSLAVGYLICVVSLKGFHLVSIKSLLIVNIVLYLLFSILYSRRLFHSGTLIKETDENLKTVFAEFKRFCLPLVLYTTIGFIYTFADYWLLQKFGGSAQQGYYAIGASFASLSLIATTSILQIFWKEVAEAYSAGNAERVRMLYHKVSRSLFYLGAVISCFLIPFSKEMLALLLGPSYQDAWLPLSLMFLYPIHQSMGQITGTMFYATERTKTQSYIGIFFMTLSIFTAYFMLAPKTLPIPGLDMGATGLALKMVLCQLVAVNLMSFFVARYISAPFDWTHQVFVLLMLLPLGFLCKLFVNEGFSLFYSGEHMIIVMVGSGLLYVIGVMTLIRFLPSIAGMNRDQISLGMSWMRARLYQL
jgi:O-antigen/teichoic acid export membrane protein